MYEARSCFAAEPCAFPDRGLMAIQTANETVSAHQPPPKRLRASSTRKPYRRSKLKRTFVFTLIALVVGLTVGASFLLRSYYSYAAIVDARLAGGYLTSRAGIYAAPRTLRVGQTITRERLVKLLSRAGYVETNASDVWSGSFTTTSDGIEVRPRHLEIANTRTPDVVQVTFDARDRISSLVADGASIGDYTLEPEVLTNDLSMKTGVKPVLAYKAIPTQLVRAILSIEDHRFFEHQGVDLFGICRALLRNAGDNEVGQGGSTITQQLVKNTYLSPERTLRRKYAEAMIAFTLERRLSKEDIFALYCNEIYLGQRGAIGIRGVEQAAHLYFGKELKDLSLAECATIAGMIQSPSRYSPHRHPDAATERRNSVLGAMLRDGAITKEQAESSVREPLAVAAINEQEDATAPYFIDYVNRVVESGLLNGSQTDERTLRVNTTIDLELQQIAEAAIARQLERLGKSRRREDARPQAALVALDPNSGNVLAMVGGNGYGESQLNRATDALRQPGSVYKPFVYAAALESGLSPVSMFRDEPQEFVYDRNAKFSPSNYGGGFSMQAVTMRTALVKSLNVVTVDVAMQTGLRRVARYAQNFGLTRPDPYPALALGTTEATPLAMAAAYATFANGGSRVEPNVVASITDASGKTLVAPSQSRRKVIEPSTAYMITDMLSDVIDHGTARAAKGIAKISAVAGKTGTSRDGWFVGYTPHLVVAVWIGFDDNAQLGLTGAEAALPVWTEVIQNALVGRPELGADRFDIPADILQIEIDPVTGRLATPACVGRELIAVTAALAPNVECYLHPNPYRIATSVDQSLFASVPGLPSEPRRRFDGDASATGTSPLIQRQSIASMSATRVTKNREGRSILENEMRVRN